MHLFRETISTPDALYMEYRDSPEREAERAYLESLWEVFRKHADPDFRENLCLDFLGRYWEMALGVFLCNNGLQLLRNTGAGPDFRITVPSPISIEAITPGPGVTVDSVPTLGQIIGHRSVGAKPNDKITLRIRSAILEKQRQYDTYRANGVVEADEAYVIAINPIKLGLVAIDTDPPHLLRATLGLGEPVAYLDHDQEEADLENTYRPIIYKRNLSQVETDIFLNESHATISAILMSFVKPQHRNLEPDVRLLHNPHALNSLSRDLLPGVTEYWIEGEELFERPPQAS